MRELIRPVLVLTVAALAASCTLGPDYKRPVVSPPGGFRGAETAAAGDVQSIANVKWFELFQDPTLTKLVTGALERNFDLRMASERVLQARALARISRSDLFPAIDGSAAAVSARASEATVPPGVDRDVTYVQAGFSVGWELDVWGRVRRLNEAARAQFFATQEARRAVTTTLIADVTQTYLLLRALDLELEIAQRTRAIAADSLRLTQARRDRGVATALDVRQAEQLQHIAGVQLAGIERDIEQTENALSLLLGQFPGDIPRGLELEAFRVPPVVPAGLPSALLERRPDIREAEQQLIAANAQIGAAKAEYFPRLSLTGFFGVQSRALSDLLAGRSGLWDASAGASLPIFNAGRTRATVQFAESAHRELLVNYERTIYTALREVSDALAGYRRTTEQRTAQEGLVDALRASARLSTQRYEGGVDNYLQVLDAQRNLFQGELDLVRLRQQELASLVQLYRALGGGWDPEAEESAG